MVLSASGTDLEYVALAAAAGQAPSGTHNILLGADEVGSGCIHSAHGRYFAERTALGVPAAAGEPVPGLDGVLVDPSRSRGRSTALGRDRGADGRGDRGRQGGGRHLVHAVHGSKTGLIPRSPTSTGSRRATATTSLW